ncbi:MAG: sulfatase [Halobacteria archaeon]|nr:sulfatase [Halobacteria archaeon]
MATDMDVSNVVLITVDSLRADAISPYDRSRHTPVFEDLAKGGTVFENAFATGNWTPFSFPSILASRPVFADTGRIGMDDSPTLAETLSSAGLTTGGFNASNGFLTSHWGYNKGFDVFESFIAEIGSNFYSRYLATHPTVGAWIQLIKSPFRRVGSWIRGKGDNRPFLDTSRMFDVEEGAISFIEDATEPFFLWVHYMDVHTPYVPAPRYIREVSSDLVGTHRMLIAHTRTGLGWEVGDRTLASLRTLYQGAVRQVDDSVGRIMKSLAEEGVDDRTAIVVAGDHGEEFQEHGHLAHYPKLYDELISVPFIINVPDAEPHRISRQVGLDSVPPTVCDILGVPSHPKWTGNTLAPSVLDGVQPADEPVVSVTIRGEEVTSQPIPRNLDDGDLLVSARTDEWTLIENTATGEHELYHRPSDPRQQKDWTKDRNKDGRRVIDNLRPAITEHAATLSKAKGDDRKMEEDVKTRLSALGYR